MTATNPSSAATRPVAPQPDLSESLSTQMASLKAQWGEMSRALKVGFVAAVLFGGYFLLESTTWQWARATGAKADQYQTELNKASNSPLLDGNVREVILAHGAIRIPPDVDEGLSRLFDAVNETLKRHKQASDWSYKARDQVRLQGESLMGVLPSGVEAAKVAGELEFTAPADVATNIIAELESDPAIDAIASVDMKRVEGRPALRVKMVVESWVEAPPRQR